LQPKVSASKQRRADVATARKAEREERKAQITEIGKKRGAIENAKVSTTTVDILET
jgi:SWI/SNF-related matrix-associated actin-dependent regulator of chromatin subfamily A member 5